MTTYLIRRLLFGIVTLLVITCFVYALARNMPGTPLTGNIDPCGTANSRLLRR